MAMLTAIWMPPAAPITDPRQPLQPSLDEPSIVEIAGCPIKLWTFELDRSVPRLRKARSLLPASELARFESVIDRGKREWLLLAGAGLREILGQELACPPGRIEIQRSRRGRPSLFSAVGPFFSLSHSGGWAAVAVSRSGPVGVDIESSERRISLDRVRALLTEPEARTVDALDRKRRVEGFLAHWTAKEACAKVIDVEPFANLRKLEISEALTEPSLVGPRYRQIGLVRLDLPAGLVGALAARRSR